MNEVKYKHWTGKQLVYFSEYIWNEKNWGWSLLALHSTIWGMKMFDMLKLKWHNVLNDDLTIREWMVYPKNKKPRPIKTNDLVLNSINKVINLNLPIKLDEPIYINHKGKPLNTSTLNREFNKFVEEFRNEIDKSTGLIWNLKPIKTNTFQIAWALDLLNEFGFNARVFGMVSRYMGHNSIADTIKLLEVEPDEDDEIFLMFNFHNNRKAFDFEKMPSEEIRNKFYNVPSTGTELWESEHVADYPI